MIQCGTCLRPADGDRCTGCLLPCTQCACAKITETVNHPDHYGGDTTYEVVKVVEAWGLDKDAYLFNAIKYIARAGKKGGPETFIQDLEKARWYLDRRIARLKAARTGD